MLFTNSIPERQSRRNRVVLSAFAFCVVASAPYATARADEGGENRPIRGWCEGVLTQANHPDYVIEYVGVASHIGEFTRTEFVSVDDTFTFFEGTFIYRAANGDEFYVAFSGGFISPTDGIGVGVITGGTGRFAGAGGQLVGTVHTEDLFHFFATIEGVISY